MDPRGSSVSRALGDSEHETLFFPDSDVAIESREHATS